MKFNGYRATHRNKWFLVKHGVLTRDELLLFDYYIDIADFDSEHDAFGTFKATYSNTATALGYKSAGSILPKHQKLIELGLIFETSEKSSYGIHHYTRYLSSSRKNPNDNAVKVAKEESNLSPAGALMKLVPKYESYEEINQLIEQEIQQSKDEVRHNPITTPHISTEDVLKALGSFKVNSSFSDTEQVIYTDEELINKSIEESS